MEKDPFILYSPGGHIYNAIYKNSQPTTPQSSQHSSRPQPITNQVKSFVNNGAGIEGKVNTNTLHRVENQFEKEQAEDSISNDNRPSGGPVDSDAASDSIACFNDRTTEADDLSGRLPPVDKVAQESGKA
ncbi:hypothetical protein ACHAPJ_012451 [Fusarium lateritium]